MNTYFRITAYNPTLDISYIIDSVDKHENIGQFCVAKKKNVHMESNCYFFDKKDVENDLFSASSFFFVYCVSNFAQ